MLYVVHRALHVSRRLQLPSLLRPIFWNPGLCCRCSSRGGRTSAGQSSDVHRQHHRAHLSERMCQPCSCLVRAQGCLAEYPASTCCSDHCIRHPRAYELALQRHGARDVRLLRHRSPTRRLDCTGSVPQGGLRPVLHGPAEERHSDCRRKPRMANGSVITRRQRRP